MEEKLEGEAYRNKTLGRFKDRDLARQAGKIGGLAKPSGIAKFKQDLSKFSRDRVSQYSPELLPLFDWFNKMDRNHIDYLLELKNVYSLIQNAMLPGLVDKLTHGESLNKKDLDALRLLKDILADSHKLKFGDKKVIEKVVTIDDIRRQMTSDKKIIDAKVIL